MEKLEAATNFIWYLFLALGVLMPVLIWVFVWTLRLADRLGLKSIKSPILSFVFFAIGALGPPVAFGVWFIPFAMSINTREIAKDIVRFYFEQCDNYVYRV